MKDGFIKAASGTPKVRVADTAYNRDSILKLIDEAEAEGVKLLALPELCLTGYTCGDLFLQKVLTDGAERALEDILRATAEKDMLFALGLPVPYGGKLYNCAAVCCRGELLCLVPKKYVPNYGEFYESRWFASGMGVDSLIRFAGQDTCICPDMVFRCDTVEGLCVGVEICEDLWAVSPPSASLASAGGATVILNLSASDELAAKAAYRRELVKSQSARLVCAYVYADAGEGESTTDMVFAGHDIIAENGLVLAEKRFHTGLAVSELDIQYLCNERKRINTYPAAGDGFGGVPFELDMSETKLTRRITPLPFVPSDRDELSQRCEEILTIAALGLKKRVEHTGSKSLVLGVSGGLDSTLAMLISVRALDVLGMGADALTAVTMPGFGTSTRTRGNAELLAERLGAKLKVISIDAAVRQHFADIGHDENNRNAVYENAQARERTQVLMDLANGLNGLVVGTGDMSELALGWATYNGDHMSMYGVNAGIPKTLVRYLVAHCAQVSEDEKLSAVLKDILATPVSPELLPSEDADIGQRTEDLVGPYEIHDFFLYHLIRRGDAPEKVLRMAEYAFEGSYDRAVILKWLRVFIRRFFSQQFKRSCLPDGPKVGSLSLSPRGDWRMPSDAVGRLWLDRLSSL